MNHSDYTDNSRLRPVPGPEIKPDRQEPGPVPRDLIPREWLENKRLPDVLAHGIVVMAAGPTGLCFLTALHYWMPRSKNVYDGKIWVYNTLEKWCGYTGLPIGTLRRTIDALVKAGIVETWRPNRRQPVRYTLNYPKLRELAKAELIKAGYWPNSECDQSGITESDQNDMTQTTESDQNDMTQTTESDQNGQTIQETNYSQENNHLQETTTRSGGGGEVDFSEGEPREGKPDQGTGQAQVIQVETESTSLSSEKDQTGTTADHPGSETYSSAAPSRGASRQSCSETVQARILARAEQKFGEALGTKNKFLSTDPAILALAFSETEVAMRTNQIKTSEMGYFITRIRHWLANPEEFQAHPDIRSRNRALASIAEFHEFFGWKTEQISPEWPEAGGSVADLDLRSAPRYRDWLIGRARGLVGKENLRIGEDPRELSPDFPQPSRYTTISMIVEADFYRNYLAWAATRPDYGSPEHMALMEKKELARQESLARLRAAKEQIYAAQSRRTPVATQRVEV